MDMFKYLLQNLPPLYKTENTLKEYKVLSKFFDDIFKKIDDLQYKYIIDRADEKTLNVLGSNIDVLRSLEMDLESYRKILKINYFNMFLVPTHNNFMRATEKVTGFFPYIKPLWTFGSDQTNDQGLYISYDLGLDYNTEVLMKLESLIGAGIKIRRDFLYKMQGVTTYPACAIFDNDILSIKCETGGK